MEVEFKDKKFNYNCDSCKVKGFSCCQKGVWVDLENAKDIQQLDLYGKFENLQQDKEYPSGWKIHTKVNGKGCSFLTVDGLCSIHKLSYELKPEYCKEFPLENNEVKPYAFQLCVDLKEEIK